VLIAPAACGQTLNFQMTVETKDTSVATGHMAVVVKDWQVCMNTTCGSCGSAQKLIAHICRVLHEVFGILPIQPFGLQCIHAL